MSGKLGGQTVHPHRWKPYVSPVPGTIPLGRDRELGEVERFLDHVREGSRSLSLTGPPGIGKTTIWREGKRRAEARGWTVLTSRPVQSEARLAFAGLADLLEPVALDELAVVQRHALEVAMLRAESGPETVDARVVGTAVLSILRTLAGRAPVVIAVDDAQWLDGASAEALSFAVRRLGALPVGVLTSVRIEGARPATFEQVLPGDEVAIGPLGVAALHEIVKVHLSIAVPRPTLVQIVVASGGNPLYAVEIARELVRKGLPAPGAKVPLPGSLMALVVTRVGLLPAETKDALLVAACLSHPTSELVDVAALEAAEEEGIVHVEDGGRIRFDHPLLAAAVYESAPVARRLAAHRRLADRVSDPEEQAVHLASGAAGPDEEIASRIEAAAARAAGRGATAMAAQLARKAVDLTPDAESTNRIRRIIAAAHYLSESGQGAAEAQRLLERGLRECEDRELRGELHFTLGQLTYGEGEDPLRHLERALELAQAPALLARIHAETAWQTRVDIRRSLQHCDAVLRLIDESELPVVYSTTLMLRAYLQLISGQGADDQAVERGWRMQEPGRDTSPVPLAWPTMRDDFSQARARYEYGLASRTAIGDELSGISLLAHLSEIELWTGNVARAEALATEAVEVVGRSGSGSFLNNALFAKGMVDAHVGRVEAARAAGERILGLEYRTADGPLRGHILLGFTAFSLDDPAKADVHYAAASSILETRGECEPARFRFHPDHAEVVIALGDLGRARGMLDHLEKRTRAFPRPWILATTARVRALVLAADGDLDRALTAIAEALAHHESLGMPFERARTMLVHGRLLRRLNQRRAARAALGEAVDEFERLCAPLWAAKGRQELARVPVRTTPAELTPTEDKIARLAAEGYTNREVAERAFVSAKTVEANLARVYNKLGVRSRAELGRVMGDRGRSVKT